MSSTVASVKGRLPAAEAKSFDRQEKFTDCLVTHFQEIVKNAAANLDYVNSKQYTQETKDKFNAILSSGIWYTQDYKKILQRCGMTKAMQWLEEEDHPRQYYGHLPANGFSPDYSFSNPFIFKVKEGVKPSQAIGSIGIKLALLDCSSIYSLAFYRALQDFIGVEKFDHLFPGGSTSFLFSPDMGMSPFAILFGTVEINTSSEIEKGDKCYFSNIPRYREKHTNGNGSGYSVIATGNKTKPFLGFGLPPQGTTKDDIERALFDAYNKDNDLCVDKSLAKHAISWESFQQTKGHSPSKQEGKLSLRVLRPLIDRIDLLARIPIESIRAVFGNFT